MSKFRSRGSVHALYVDPENGNNSWTGLAAPTGTDGPFQSITAAQTAARALIAEMVANTRPRKAIKVILHPGTYRLATALSFGQEDSGTRDCPVSYESLTPGAAVISGGVVLAPSSADTTSVTYFTPTVSVGFWSKAPQLYVSGSRATLARYPNAGGYWFVSEGVLQGAETVAKKAFRSHNVAAETYLATLTQADKDRGFLVVYQSWSIGRHRLGVVDATPDYVTVTPDTDWAFKSLGGDSQRVYVENVAAALDAQGDWIGDDTSIQYIKRTGDVSPSTSAVLPVLEKLMTVDGGTAGTRVQHLHFRGLKFEHAVNLTPTAGLMDAQAAVDVIAAIEVNFARNITFDNCTMTRLGGFAVWFKHDVRESLIKKCTMTDLGAGAIKLGEIWYAEETAGTGTGQNEVTQNVITDTGKVWQSAAAIWGGKTWDNVISKNLIARTTYSAITLGWQWSYDAATAGRNRVVSNLLYNIGQAELGDQAAIYTVGVSPGTVIEKNVIREVRGYPNYGVSAWGMYGDTGSSNIEHTDNIIVGTDGGGYHLGAGRNILLQGNVLARGDNAEIRSSMWQAEPANTTNLTVADNLILPLMSTTFISDISPGIATIVYSDNLVSNAAAPGGTVNMGACGAECVLDDFSITSTTAPRGLTFSNLDAARLATLNAIVSEAGPDWEGALSGEVVELTRPTSVTL